MSQTELQHLAHIREAGGRTNRFLQTINANIIHLDSSVRQMTEALKVLTRELTRDVDLDKLVEDSRKIAEAGKNFEKIVDANDVELPAEIEPSESYKVMTMDGKNEVKRFVPDDLGRLFPHEWRHNLGFDKISEDLREYHRTYENHPMTEEAFRIYNAGLTKPKMEITRDEAGYKP